MSEESTDLQPITNDETTEEFSNRIIAMIEARRRAIYMLRD